MLGLKNPFTPKNILIGMGRDEKPGMVMKKSFKFTSHGNTPGRELGSLIIGKRFFRNGLCIG